MKLKNKQFRKGVVLLAFVFLILVVFFVPKQTLAKEGEAVAGILGWVLLPIISLIGKLITVMIRLLVTVAQYNDFIASPAVSKGWIIIRDIFNMFFIFILLIIAFGTVLKIEKYSYKRLLAGFLLAAVLVNFSKLICGIFIDIAQIIMLTFVNAFKSVGEGNMAELLGLKSLMSLSKESGGETLNKELIGALCLGFIMSAIALVVVTIITLIFVFRIVILWFLVLLSPLAFMGSVLPSLQSYAKQWWEKFSTQVIIGPVLAFFLWLSFAMVQDQVPQGGVYKSVVPSGSSLEETISGELTTTTKQTQPLSAAISEAGKPQYVLNFIIGIAMLLGSLMVAQQLGVAGGKMAGNALAKIQAIGAGAAKAPFRGLGAIAKGGKFLAREGIKDLEAKWGVPLTKASIKRDWQTAMARRDWLREAQRKAKRTELAEQIEEKGISPGIVNFTKDVLGVGKRKIKKGEDIIKDAEKIKGKFIPESEMQKKQQELKKKEQEYRDKQTLGKDKYAELDEFIARTVSPEITRYKKKSYTSKDKEDEEVLNDLLAKANDKKTEYIKTGDVEGRANIDKEIIRLKSAIDGKKDVNLNDFTEINALHQPDYDRAIKLENETDRVKSRMEIDGEIDLYSPLFSEIKKIYTKSNSKWAKEIDALDKDIDFSTDEIAKKQGFVLDDKTWDEKVNQPLKVGADLKKSGKAITEPIGPYGRRAAEAALIREERKRLPEIYDQQEYIGSAREFEEKGDWIKFKAVMTQMVEHGDINEPLLADAAKYKEDFNTKEPEGWDRWAQHLAEKFNKPLGDIRRSLNEWGTMAMYNKQDRMSSPYIYDETIKDIRLKTKEEFKQLYLYDKGGKDVERQTRESSKLAYFGEEVDLATGQRRPVMDDLVRDAIINSLLGWEREVDNKRMNKDAMYYAGCPTNIEFMITRVLPKIAPQLSKEEIDKFIELTKKLRQQWAMLGRPDPGGRIDLPPESLAGRLAPEQIKIIAEELGISLRDIGIV